ncbi:MAG: hypothetical protein EOO03_04360 [Chitinophagaceae bacterium]|nr:MAG: hypothetical protein EOO03_04360 [Chitinophagaceae bacterium]
MTRQITIILLVGLLSFFASCKGQTKEKSKDIETLSEKFKVGQVWKYDNRPGEDNSTLTVLKIEKYKKGDTIIHIRVDGIRMYNPNVASGYSNFLGHMPYSEKAISKSVTTLVRQNDTLPDFSEGYNQWKESWDNGKGGYWTIDLKGAIEGMDSVMRQKQ